MPRSLIKPIALACFAFGALQASAATVTHLGSFNGGVASAFAVTAPNVAASGNAVAGGFRSSLDGGATSFETYCIDLYQTVGTSSDYSLVPGATHFVAPHANANADIGKLYAFHGAVNDATSEAAFQLAIWEIAFETNAGPYALGSGTAQFSSNAAVTTLASFWLANLPAASLFDVQVLQSSRRQDLVFATPAIPEPSTYALMAAGLLGVGFLARRRLPNQR